MANTCSFVGRRIIVQQKKNLESRTQLDEPAECTSGGDPLLLQNSAFTLSLWYEFFVHYALRVEKNYQHGLNLGPLEFQFLRPRGRLTNPFTTLSLCFGVIGKTPGLISHNNFVKKSVCIGHRDNVLARCDSIFPLFRCQVHTTFFPKSSFRIRTTTVLGMLKDSTIILDAIRRSFLTKSATAAMFTSVRVDFGRPSLSSSSTSSLPSRNREYHLKTFDRVRFSFP